MQTCAGVQLNSGTGLQTAPSNLAPIVSSICRSIPSGIWRPAATMESEHKVFHPVGSRVAHGKLRISLDKRGVVVAAEHGAVIVAGVIVAVMSAAATVIALALLAS